MIYRKAPPQPARRLLRIVTHAGASALLGTAACGGATTTDHPFNGTVVMPEGSSGSAGVVNGVAPGLPSGSSGEGTGASSGFFPGSIAQPSGSFSGAGFITGVLPAPSGSSAGDSSGSSGSSSGTPLIGVLPEPSGSSSGFLGASGLPAGIVCNPCGVVALPVDAGPDAKPNKDAEPYVDDSPWLGGEVGAPIRDAGHEE